MSICRYWTQCTTFYTCLLYTSTIRKELYSLMGRSMFYRIRNKERMLHPDEQKKITDVFLKHGIENKPEFDKYIDLFDW